MKYSENRALTNLQKQINQGVSTVRAKVEYAFSGVKRLGVVKEKLRLKREIVMGIAVGLYNIRTISRQ